ncbi:MAG: HAMP domain-containing sensor histidine kinase, partial [Bacteroidota bacterium]
NQFSFYSSFFDDSISKNVNRTLRVLRARDLINEFINVIKPDIDKLNIKVRSEFYNIEIFLTPSHPSEWKSIFFNLYTNSKKAIKRASVEGKILILSGIENDSVYFEFHDNGDGVPEEFSHRIFDAFFTTSNPAIFDADNDYSGTGLGLKIVRDIIENRGGRIFLESPEKGYSTCFKIEMPIPTEKEIEEYGN